VAKLVEDFVHSPGIDPELETHFRTFLARQRVRCGQLCWKTALMVSRLQQKTVDCVNSSRQHSVRQVQGTLPARAPPNTHCTVCMAYLHPLGMHQPLLTEMPETCARRSFPKLESTLDWVLQLYWVFLPALVRHVSKLKLSVG